MDSADKWDDRITKWEALYAEKRTVYEKIIDYYNNEFPKNLLSVNLVFSYGRAMVPQLYFKNPSVTVDISRPGNDDIARTLQLLDNKLLKAMQVKKTIKKMIVNAYCYGRGVAKLGFSDPDDSMLVNRMTGAMPNTTLPLYKMRSMIAPNQPWFMHFYPDDFAFDYQISELEDSAWQGMRFELSNEQLLEMDLNKKLKQPSEEGQDPDHKHVFWEIWDKESGEFCIIEDGELVQDPQPIGAWPFYVLDFNWVPRNPIPVSDAELILSLQDEYNEIKTQIHDHRRTSILKIIARKNALDREAKQKMESGVVGPIVEIDGVPGETIAEFKPSIPMDLFTTANTTDNDVKNVIGFTRNQLGEYNTSGDRTAREAQIVQNAIMIRLDERRDMVGDLISDLMTSVNDLVAERWDSLRVEQFAGISLGWEKVQDVQSEYVVGIVGDSSLPLSRQVQQAEAKEMYMTLRQDPFIDQIRLRAKYLSAFETGDLTLIAPPTMMQPGMAPGGGAVGTPQPAPTEPGPPQGAPSG